MSEWVRGGFLAMGRTLAAGCSGYRTVPHGGNPSRGITHPSAPFRSDASVTLRCRGARPSQGPGFLAPRGTEGAARGQFPAGSGVRSPAEAAPVGNGSGQEAAWPVEVWPLGSLIAPGRLPCSSTGTCSSRRTGTGPWPGTGARAVGPGSCSCSWSCWPGQARVK
jgi:hypothetical protein